jgi:YD repeat-containing protein
MTAHADTDVPWLAIDQLDDWKSIVGLVMTLPAALDTQLKRDAGMNLFEYHLLVALERAERHALPMSDLAATVRSSPSRLSHAVSRLERNGWVERFACHEAGRRTSAMLTAAGLTKLEESAPGHVREVRRLVMDVLTPDQLRALGEGSRAIVERASPDALDGLALPAC